MRYVPNPRFAQEMERDARFRQRMLDIAEEIVDRTQANGGRFTKGYKAVRTEGGARAGTDYSLAHWDEWGNRYRAPRAPLRRALASLGLLGKTKEAGKP